MYGELDRCLLLRSATALLRRIASITGAAWPMFRRRREDVAPAAEDLSVMDFALGVLVLVTSLTTNDVPRDGGHVRTLDTRLQAEINEGLARSALFRELVTRLDRSDVIVYIETECPMSPRIFGRLSFMGSSGGRRYVNVHISCALSDAEQIAALGHELRHAVEIADAPSVIDVASLAAEYERIGFPSHGARHGSGFESSAAKDAARQVWAELGRTGE